MAQNEGEAEAAPKVVTADIEAGIKDYIAQKVEEGNGKFHLKTEDYDMQMELVRVHTEYLANLGPESHFACVDLADAKGDVYDVDFFLEGPVGEMDVTSQTVHKLNGKPFYSWKQREDKTWYTVPVEESDNALLGVIEGEDHFEFHYHITLPVIEEPAQMWIPLAESDDYQEIEIISRDLPVEGRVLEDEEYGNNILFLQLGPEQSGEEIELVYDVLRKEKQAYAAAPPDEKYLQAGNLLPVNERFRSLSDSIIQARAADNPLMKARALYDYIIEQLRYMKWKGYGSGDANYACDAKTGNCSEFHSFFISLARSAEIPARFAIGAGIPSSRNEGGIDGYHCWAEFYAEGKWWPVDISEADKYTPLATYYFGHHPANRIELSRGRDINVSPGPQSGTINFLAYPVLEIGGKTAACQTFFSFQRIEE